MKISSKILALNMILVVIFWSLGLSGINQASAKYYPQDQDIQSVNQNSAAKRFEHPLNDSLQKILCDKQSPYFTNLDPDTGQHNVALNSIIKFTVIDSFLPKPKYEWDRYGVDIDSIFISITTRKWSVEHVKPHSVILADSIFEVDCEYYPEKPFDWTNTVKVHLSVQDVSYLRNYADTTYYFYTIRDTLKPILTPIFPEPEMVDVPNDSIIRIHGKDIGRGVDLHDIKLWIDDSLVVSVVNGDLWNFEISYIPATGWSYNDSIHVFCLVKDLDGNAGTLDYWFKTLARPSVPQLLSPPNDAVAQDTSLTLEWYESERATGYRLQVSADPNFQDLNVLKVDSENLKDIKYSVQRLSKGATYYWRVNASNAAGTSAWSEVWHFTTWKSEVVGLRPLPPQLLSPPNDVVNQNTSLILAWQKSERASIYRLQVSLDYNFTSFIINKKTRNIDYELRELSEGNVYYWRVNASNVHGTSEWSDVWHFSTYERTNNRLLLPPQLVFPANGAGGLDTYLTLIWYKSKRATEYGLQVSLNAGFSELIVDKTHIKETSFKLNELSQETGYYWRVNASNDEETSVWSKVWYFTTKVQGNQPPLPPQLISPPNGAVDLDTSLTLVWKESEEATHYGVQVSLDSNFNNFRYEEITATLFDLNGLLRDTVYYWRANASNDFGTSDWSEIWHFRTTGILDTIPPVITAISPDSGETNVPVTTVVDFRVWDDLSGVEEMKVYLDIVSNRVNVVSQQPDMLKKEEKMVDFRYQPVDSFAYMDLVKVHVYAEDKAGNSADKYYEFETEPEVLANLKIFNFTSSAGGNPVKVKTPVTFEAFISCEYSDCSDSFTVCFYLENSEEPFFSVTKENLKVGEIIPIPTTSIQWTTEGRYPVTVMVDAFNNINESNEEDNEAKIFVQVGGAQLTVRSNPFTPNDDGINDEAEFNFEQFQVENPNLKIFDMHGKKVREFNRHNNNRYIWDGRDSSGRALLPGIYLYILSDRDNAIARGCIVIAK